MERLKTCRETMGLSQKYVAVSVGVSPPTVSMWESGQKDPTRENLVKLADLFNVTTDYLLERDVAGTAMPVSPDEREILLACRQAPQVIQEAVRSVLKLPERKKENGAAAI